MGLDMPYENTPYENFGLAWQGLICLMRIRLMRIRLMGISSPAKPVQSSHKAYSHKAYQALPSQSKVLIRRILHLASHHRARYVPEHTPSLFESVEVPMSRRLWALRLL